MVFNKILGCTLTLLVTAQITLIIHHLRGPYVNITPEEKEDHTKRLNHYKVGLFNVCRKPPYGIYIILYFQDRQYKWFNVAGRDFKTAYKGPDYENDDST
jgi:hypothetical protein